MVFSNIIIVFVSGIVGMILGILISGNALLSDLKKQFELARKYMSFFALYDTWLLKKQMGKSVKEYFENNKYKRVAIYGMGKIGVRFYEELKLEEVEVLYVIDRNAKKLNFDVECLLPEDEFQNIDVIVVTAINSYNEIKEAIQSKTQCAIISLENVISDL